MHKKAEHFLNLSHLLQCKLCNCSIQTQACEHVCCESMFRTHFSEMRLGCWMRSVACGRHGNWGPPGGRWRRFCRSPRCLRGWTRSSRLIRWASGHPRAAGTANRGPRTLSQWWCWELRTAAAWAWCQWACTEQSELQNTQHAGLIICKQIRQSGVACYMYVVCLSLGFIFMSYASPPLTRP